MRKTSSITYIGNKKDSELTSCITYIANKKDSELELYRPSDVQHLSIYSESLKLLNDEELSLLIDLEFESNNRVSVISNVVNDIVVCSNIGMQNS